MAEYTPEQFAPPFREDFDPRSDVYEVVERDASGALRVTSASGQRWTVAPTQVAAGLTPNPQERVLGVLESAKKAGFFGKLLGRERGAEVSLRIEALRPNRTEIEFAQSWLQSLIKAGLRIEGVDLDGLLAERLRTAPFGSGKMAPLRKILRGLLEDLVGRFPQRDDSWGADDAPGLARQLLADLGVGNFEPPALERSVEHRWHVLEPLAVAANRALQAAGTPLRLVPCEREVFPQSAIGEDRDDLAALPVWLVLVPAIMPALEAAAVVRRYRGAIFPTAAAAGDPRVLKPRAPEAEPTASVHPIESGPMDTGSGPPEASAPPPAATNPGPPQVPCRATIRSFVVMDSVGDLVTDDGVSVRFGASACKGFEPRVGMGVWLIGFGPHPLGKGYRATVLNLSGRSEETRREEAAETNRLEHARRERERELLARHHMKEESWHRWKQLTELTPDARRALAADLVQLKRESHLFDRLFEELVTVDAESLHPFLSELDWKAEPESLAWTRAPFESIGFAEATLSNSAAVQLRERVPVGTVAPSHELARRIRAPANDVGAAVLALARSGSPDAIARLTRWLSESSTPAEQADELLIVAGWQLHDGRPKQLWGHRTALHVRRAPDGRGHLFEPSDSRCPACKSNLLCLLRDSSTQVIPFPLFTCANCTPVDITPYYVEVSTNGAPTALLLQALDEDYEPTIERDTAPTSVRVAFESAPWAVPDDIDEFEHVTRIGGSPSWVQSPESAGACPKCAVPMEFLAQFPDPPACEIWGGDAGMLYVFACTDCRIAASFVQNA
jgi:hypothetical protein